MRHKRKYTKKVKPELEMVDQRDKSSRPDIPLHKVEDWPTKDDEEVDVEDVPESEADAMIERAAKRREEEKQKVEAEVDKQEWSASDPLIPEDLKSKVWIAVYKCPEGHKTKATNRQAKTGIHCGACRIQGKTVKADVMPQFLEKPIPPDDDNEKRKQAARGKA